MGHLTPSGRQNITHLANRGDTYAQFLLDLDAGVVAAAAAESSMAADLETLEGRIVYPWIIAVSPVAGQGRALGDISFKTGNPNTVTPNLSHPIDVLIETYNATAGKGDLSLPNGATNPGTSGELVHAYTDGAGKIQRAWFKTYAGNSRLSFQVNNDQVNEVVLIKITIGPLNGETGNLIASFSRLLSYTVT